MDTDAQLAQYFAGMWPHLDEHARRLVAASQAVELGYGGISRVSRACGLSRVTLIKGVEELQSAPLAPGRVRREGGGRHALTSNDPGLAPALDGMVEPTARGDPQSDRKSTRLNSSHLGISYAVFCLKKKNKPQCSAASLYIGSSLTAPLLARRFC